MKWFAVKGPDGRTISVEPTKSGAWWRANLRKRFSQSTTDRTTARQGERLGYRCVEVQLVDKDRASALEQAFIQGAAWWEWHKEGATMWQSDRALALEEAERRTANGTLGKSPEINAVSDGGEGKAEK